MAEMGKTNKKWQVFGREQVQYDHVGTPRFYYRDYWGETFDDFGVCLAVCQRTLLQNIPRFLIVYPREYDPNRENMAA